MPDIVYILLNGTVGSEFTGACGIKYCHLSPSLLILVCLFNLLLSLCIGLEVLKYEVGIGP